jgi:uncharacterized protein
MRRRRASVTGSDRRRRWPYAILAYLFAGLAIAGLAIPGLPTTPFVLLAAWAASRGSERIHSWLTNHRRLGPALRQWNEEGAVASRAKLLAVSFLALSWVIMWRLGTRPWLLVALAVLFIVVGTFVVTRPRPRTGR